MHSKNTRSAWPGKGSIGTKHHSGSTMTGKSVKLTNNGVRLTQLLVKFRVKLTDFRVIVGTEWSLALMDPFPGHADPGVFRVCTSNLYARATASKTYIFSGLKIHLDTINAVPFYYLWYGTIVWHYKENSINSIPTKHKHWENLCICERA